MTATTTHKHHHHGDDRIAAAKSLLLLGMGAYLALLILTGNLTNYINLRFAWLAYVGAALFGVLGCVSVWSMLRPAEDEHAHYEIGWDILAIVALPLVLAMIVPSRALGVEAINGGVSLSPVGVSATSGFSRSPLDRNVLDWLREFDRAAPSSFDDMPADVIGFVYREPAFAADEFMLSRFTMSCCVADAFPIGMPVSAVDAPEFETGAWARVQGALQATLFGDELLPVLLADVIEPVDEPRQPYLYP